MNDIEEIVKYETTLGEITLSPSIIRKYLVSGGGQVSDQEIKMFLMLCKYQKLNPFLREAYLIKYGADQPATIVTGKEAFLKRAKHCAGYQGHEVGLGEWSGEKKTAWAQVYVEGYKVPVRVEVDYAEYVGKKKTGEITKMWSEKPKTMLKKVALVQALREAFPEEFGGMYSQEEINTVDAEKLSTSEVKIGEGRVTEEINYAEEITRLMEVTGITSDGMKELGKKHGWQGNKTTEGLRQRYEYLKQLEKPAPVVIVDDKTGEQTVSTDKSPAPGTQPNPPKAYTQRITADQAIELTELCNKLDVSQADLFGNFFLRSMAELYIDDYAKAKAWIEKQAAKAKKK